MTDAQDLERDVVTLYRRILDGWNRASAEDFAAAFSETGEVIRYDGSEIQGRAAIVEEMGRIFTDHPTGRYVGKVREVRLLGTELAVLRAVAGVVPAGQADLDPELNSVQSLVANFSDGEWRVVLYQNTPAQFHGRPELVESLNEELRRELEGLDSGGA